MLNSPTEHRLPLGGPIVAYYRVPCGFRLSRHVRVAVRTVALPFYANPAEQPFAASPFAMSRGSLSALSFRDNGPCVWETYSGRSPFLILPPPHPGNGRCNIFERLHACEFRRVSRLRELFGYWLMEIRQRISLAQNWHVRAALEFRRK